jgi:hypothetical protein
MTNGVISSKITRSITHQRRGNRENMVRAIGSWWKNTIQDFIATNKSGVFHHCIPSLLKYIMSRCRLYQKEDKSPLSMLPSQGKSCRGFLKDEDELDDHICGLKKRKKLKMKPIKASFFESF